MSGDEFYGRMDFERQTTPALGANVQISVRWSGYFQAVLDLNLFEDFLGDWVCDISTPPASLDVMGTWTVFISAGAGQRTGSRLFGRDGDSAITKPILEGGHSGCVMAKFINQVHTLI